MILKDVEQRELDRYTGLYDFTRQLQNKCILITGTKGIVGSGLIKWILYENQHHHTNVHIIASTRDPQNVPLYIENSDNIEFCQFGHEEKTCQCREIDYIIHAAAPTSNRVFKMHPVESLKVILDGTERMLEMAKAHKATMLFFSSSEAYGTPTIDVPISEEYVGAIDSLNTRSCYPLGKKIAELLCKSYFEEYEVNVKIIRPTVILGLWQPYDSVKVEAEILRSVIESQNFVMKSDGSTKKSVIYSLDAISAALTVLFKGHAGEAYNATNPSTYCSVKERAVDMIEKFNPAIHIEYEATDTSVAQGYLQKHTLLENIEKIKELGWEPKADVNHIYSVDIERFGANSSLQF